jgi:hypothetical protein
MAQVTDDGKFSRMILENSIPKASETKKKLKKKGEK